MKWGRFRQSTVVVTACDSEYVVKGISEWVPKLKNNGRSTTRRTPVESRDLWEQLLAALREQDDRGVLIQFWLISRDDNEADSYAKVGKLKDRPECTGKVTAFEGVDSMVG